MKDYVNLLEKRILALFPNHPLPVRESHFNLIKPEEEISKNNFHQIIIEQKNKIAALETNNKELSNQLAFLKNKLQSCEINYSNSKDRLNKIKLINKPNFRSNEGLQSKSIKLNSVNSDLNSNSEFNMAEDTISKSINNNELIKMLNKETLNNEELRKYIEILKETLESSIIKHGLDCYLNNQRVYYKENNISNLHIAIDIVKYIGEIDKLNKEVITYKNKLHELNEDLNHLSNEKSELNIKLNNVTDILNNTLRDKELLEESIEKLQKNLDDNQNKNKNLLGNTQNIKSELLDKLNYINSLKLNCNQLTNNNKNLNDKIKEQEKKINLLAEYEKDISNLHSNIYNLKKDKIILQSNIETLKSDIENLNYKLENNKKEEELEKNVISQDNNNLHKETQSLSDNLLIKQEEILKLESKIKEKESEISDLKNEIINSKEITNAGKSQMSFIEKRIKEKDGYYERTKRDLEQKIKEKLNLIIELTKEKEKLKESNNNLNIKLDQKDLELINLSEEIKQLKWENTTANQDLSITKEENKKINALLDQLKDNISANERALLTLKNKNNKEIHKLSLQMEELSVKNNTFSTENKSKNEEIKSLQSKIDNQIQNIDIIKRENYDKDLLIKKLSLKEQNLNILSEENQDLNKKINYLTSTIEDLNANINKLNCDMNLLLNEKSDKDMQIFKQEETINKLNKEINIYSSSLYELKDKHNILKKESDEKNSHIQENLHILNNNKQEISNLKDNNDKYFIKNKNMINKLSDLQKSYDKLNIEYINLNRINNNIKKDNEYFNNIVISFNNKIFNLYHFVNDLLKNNCSNLLLELSNDQKSVFNINNLEEEFDIKSVSNDKTKTMINIDKVIEYLRSLINNTSNKCNNLLEEKVSLNNVVKSLKNEIEKLTSYNNQKEFEYNDSINKLNSFNIKISTKENHISELKVINSELEKRILFLEGNIKDKTFEINQLLSEKNVLNNKNNSYIQENENIKYKLKELEIENTNIVYEVRLIENKCIIGKKEKSFLINIINLLSKLNDNLSLEKIVNNIVSVSNNMYLNEEELESIKLKNYYNINNTNNTCLSNIEKSIDLHQSNLNNLEKDLIKVVIDTKKDLAMLKNQEYEIKKLTLENQCLKKIN